MGDNKTAKLDLVYILGTSFSGSTLLGYILGDSPKVENLGELGFFNKIKNSGGEMCTCGKNAFECTFWSDIYRQDYTVFGGFSFITKIDIISKSIMSNTFKRYVQTTSDVILLDRALNKVQEKNKQVAYLLDTSKSLWRLVYLMNCREIALKIIYLRRDIQGNVCSFKKHGVGFWQGVYIHKVSNWLMSTFLKNNGIEHVQIDYRELCESPQRVLQAIGEYLDVDYSNYTASLMKREYHIASGNQGTRGQVLNGFKKLKYDDSWKQMLNTYEKAVLRVLG